MLLAFVRFCQFKEEKKAVYCVKFNASFRYLFCLLFFFLIQKKTSHKKCDKIQFDNNCRKYLIKNILLIMEMTTKKFMK